MHAYAVVLASRFRFSRAGLVVSALVLGVTAACGDFQFEGM